MGLKVTVTSASHHRLLPPCPRPCQPLFRCHTSWKQIDSYDAPHTPICICSVQNTHMSLGFCVSLLLSFLPAPSLLFKHVCMHVCV